MIKHPGILRILEFKREANKSAKERAKLWMLQTCLRSKAFNGRERKTLRRISRQVHWYAEIPTDVPSKVRVTPYLDMRKRGRLEMRLADFVRQTADEVATYAATREEMLAFDCYLHLLALCRAPRPFGVLVVFISGGQVHYDVVSDFQELVKPKEVLEAEYLAVRERVAAKEKIEIGCAYERVKELDHYVSLDLSVSRPELIKEKRLEHVNEAGI